MYVCIRCPVHKPAESNSTDSPASGSVQVPISPTQPRKHHGVSDQYLSTCTCKAMDQATANTNPGRGKRSRAGCMACRVTRVSQTAAHLPDPLAADPVRRSSATRFIPGVDAASTVKSTVNGPASHRARDGSGILDPSPAAMDAVSAGYVDVTFPWLTKADRYAAERSKGAPANHAGHGETRVVGRTQHADPSHRPRYREWLRQQLHPKLSSVNLDLLNKPPHRYRTPIPPSQTSPHPNEQPHTSTPLLPTA
jgi:hypothetical protein